MHVKCKSECEVTFIRKKACHSEIPAIADLKHPPHVSLEEGRGHSFATRGLLEKQASGGVGSQHAKHAGNNLLSNCKSGFPTGNSNRADVAERAVPQSTAPLWRAVLNSSV